jgi:hypothetical protein
MVAIISSARRLMRRSPSYIGGGELRDHFFPASLS